MGALAEAIDYAQLAAESALDTLFADRAIVGYGGRLHSLPADVLGELPEFTRRIRDLPTSDATAYQAGTELAEALTRAEGEHLPRCARGFAHGDFSARNVLLTADQPPGVALDPQSAAGAALSPVTGTVVMLHPHAFIVSTPEDAAVLVHLGIDTVALRGEGFTPHVLHGETVCTGQPVISWDPAAVRASGRSALCPVIALDTTTAHLAHRHHPGPIAEGDPLFDWRR